MVVKEIEKEEAVDSFLLGFVYLIDNVMTFPTNDMTLVFIHITV